MRSTIYEVLLYSYYYYYYYIVVVLLLLYIIYLLGYDYISTSEGSSPSCIEKSCIWRLVTDIKVANGAKTTAPSERESGSWWGAPSMKAPLPRCLMKFDSNRTEISEDDFGVHFQKRGTPTAPLPGTIAMWNNIAHLVMFQQAVPIIFERTPLVVYDKRRCRIRG